MECSGDLNDGLKEGFVGLVASEPDSLPVLMRNPELLIAIATQAFGKCTVSPVKGHRFHIIKKHAECVLRLVFV